MNAQSPSRFFYARFETPKQFAVVRVNGQPSYLDCADCGAKEPMIGGITLDAWGQIAVIPTGNGLFVYAAYCVACFAKRWEENERRMPPDVPGEHIRVSGVTLLGREG